MKKRYFLVSYAQKSYDGIDDSFCRQFITGNRFPNLDDLEARKGADNIVIGVFEFKNKVDFIGAGGSNK